MLPSVKEQTEEKCPKQAGHPDIFTPILCVCIADDIGIIDSLFKMDFDRHQLLSQALNFALRARGFRRRSSSEAVTTFFVNTFPAVTGVRNLFFTIRSSSEWNEITTSRPPGRTTVMAPSIKDSRLLSSSFTKMRRA